MKSVASLRLPVERLIWNTWKLSGVIRGNFQRNRHYDRFDKPQLVDLLNDLYKNEWSR